VRRIAAGIVHRAEVSEMGRKLVVMSAFAWVSSGAFTAFAQSTATREKLAESLAGPAAKGELQAITTLLEKLSSETEPRVRMRAVSALGQSGARKDDVCRTLKQAATRDSSEAVRLLASRAGKIVCAPKLVRPASAASPPDLAQIAAADLEMRKATGYKTGG
jgi:hypothetical protein